MSLSRTVSQKVAQKLDYINYTTSKVVELFGKLQIPLFIPNLPIQSGVAQHTEGDDVSTIPVCPGNSFLFTES